MCLSLSLVWRKWKAVISHGIYRKFISTNNLHSKEIYHLEFKQYKSMISRLTTSNKLKFYKTFFSERKTNSKQTWEAVRSLINVKTKLNKQITSLNINNQIETKTKTIPEVLTSFSTQLLKMLITKLFPLTKIVFSILYKWWRSRIPDKRNEHL